jgi:hypothetical protein
LQLPKYWQVGKDRPIDGVANSRFISISNSEPLSGEEFLVITAIDAINTLPETLNNVIEQSRTSYSKRNIEFGLLDQVKTVAIGLHNTLRVDFETKLLAKKYNGSFTVFNLKNKTYSCISSAEAKNFKEHTVTVDSIIRSIKFD